MRALVFCCLLAIASTDAQHFGGVCEIKGRIYKIGELFLDGCSYCVCKNDLSVNCNHKMCEHLHKDARDLGGGCKIKGRIYEKGEEFMDGCNYCVCKKDLSVTCNHRMCNHLQTAKDFCDDGKKTYKKGKISIDGCKVCFCSKDLELTCSDEKCRNVRDVNSVDATCKRNGKVYKKGESFRLHNCNKCTCHEKNKVICDAEKCTNQDCHHEGRRYKVGDYFRRGCVNCACTEYGIDCSIAGCSSLNDIFKMF